MKNLMYLLIVLINCNCNFAQRNSIIGSGNVVMENRPVSSFSKIKLEGVYKAILQQGNEDNVKVETDNNLQQLIIANVNDGLLTVKMKERSNFKEAKKMVVYISFKNIDDIKNSLVGDLQCDGPIKLEKLNYKSSAVGKTQLELDIKDLDLNISAVGKTELKGIVENCNFVNTAVGNFDGEELFINNLTLKNSAVGNTIYNAKNEKVNISAIGKTVNKNVK